MKKVVASLKYGRIYKKSLILLFLAFLFGLFFVIYGFFMFFNNKEYSDMVGIICCFLSGVLFIVGSLYMIIKNHINITNCKKWLQDSVELTATCESVCVLNIKTVKIKVVFKYNKKKYIKYSGTKASNGFDSLFFRYANTKIKILYSPKFDEVMILDE